MRLRFLVVLAVGVGLSLPLYADQHARDPKAILSEVVAEAGGADALRRRKDVEYVYLYRRGDTGAIDLSLERYVFDGEKSWARYDVHEMTGPTVEGPIVQGYDGKTSWQTAGGTLQTGEASLARADFLRKTNFYWFAMTFKLLDPGMNYTYEGRRKVGQVSYDLVKVTFEAGVGDVSDTYVFFVNTKTKRIDRFLFTVLDFGKTDPFLMEVDYARVDGVLLPVKRRYTPSDWSGKVAKGAKWTDEVSVGIRFDNGFEASMFEPPKP